MSSTALSRLIVVANRLPITATKNDATGEYTFKMSSGGLVSALVSVRSRLKFVWLGWLGQEIPVEDQPRIREQLLAEFNAIPVFLSEEIAEQYYNGGLSSQLKLADMHVQCCVFVNVFAYV